MTDSGVESEATRMSSQTVGGVGGGTEPRHFARMFVIWLILATIADVLYYTLLGPHIPPGTMTTSAKDDQFDFNILFIIALPVIIGVWTYLGYSLVIWRAGRKGLAEPVGGEWARGNKKVQIGWIASTSAVVMGLFVFGTVALVIGAGSGGGEGPSPVWSPASKNPLQVQVIAQQWKFTYRYPSFGGFETSQLVLPNDTTIEFHVTSLDVIHDFWAYQLAVKADANPMSDNIAFTTTRELGSVTVRCDELCGLWHGAMFNYGKVVTPAAFESWATSTEAATAVNTKLLPPYATTYVPDANGADGALYPTNVYPYSASEVYGAKVAAS